jgi:hypothetical protein
MAAPPTRRRGPRPHAEFLPSLGAWRLRVSVGQERTILARLRADPEVLHADLNYLVFAQD